MTKNTAGEGRRGRCVLRRKCHPVDVSLARERENARAVRLEIYFPNDNGGYSRDLIPLHAVADVARIRNGSGQKGPPRETGTCGSVVDLRCRNLPRAVLSRSVADNKKASLNSSSPAAAFSSSRGKILSREIPLRAASSSAPPAASKEPSLAAATARQRKNEGACRQDRNCANYAN